MAFWNKKKKTSDSTSISTPSTSIQCRHKWKDFPWYYEGVYYSDTHKLDAKIIEPYVCIHCKKRKDIVLKNHQRIDISYDEANEFIEQWIEKYKDHMEDRAIVEDMIHDMQLVDREYLAIAESLTHPSSNDLETEMQQLIKTVKAGHLPILNPDDTSSLVKKTTT